jgi:hypothetical protein
VEASPKAVTSWSRQKSSTTVPSVASEPTPVDVGCWPGCCGWTCGRRQLRLRPTVVRDGRCPVIGGPELGGPELGGPVIGGPVIGGPVIGGPVIGGPGIGGPGIGGPGIGGWVIARGGQRSARPLTWYQRRPRALSWFDAETKKAAGLGATSAARVRRANRSRRVG